MKNVHMCELSQKGPQVAVGENFNFFDFLKSFLKWRKSSSFTPGHLEYKNSLIWIKNVRVWIEPKRFPSSEGESFNFVDLF